MTLVDRIRRGEAAIAAAKLQGRDVRDWERHLDQLKSQTQAVTVDDPLLTVETWFPIFHQFHAKVIAETQGFDYRWLKEHRPELHRQIKAVECHIDSFQHARLSAIMTAMHDWRALVLKAHFEQKKDEVQSALSELQKAPSAIDGTFDWICEQCRKVAAAPRQANK
jgi:hypothetical protein